MFLVSRPKDPFSFMADLVGTCFEAVRVSILSMQWIFVSCLVELPSCLLKVSFFSLKVKDTGLDHGVRSLHLLWAEGSLGIPGISWHIWLDGSDFWIEVASGRFTLGTMWPKVTTGSTYLNLMSLFRELVRQEHPSQWLLANLTSNEAVRMFLWQASVEDLLNGRKRHSAWHHWHHFVAFCCFLCLSLSFCPCCILFLHVPAAWAFLFSVTVMANMRKTSRKNIGEISRKHP